eukprot:1872702-Alexandrium_andersonii.AAC.1
MWVCKQCVPGSAATGHHASVRAEVGCEELERLANPLGQQGPSFERHAAGQGFLGCERRRWLRFGAVVGVDAVLALPPRARAPDAGSAAGSCRRRVAGGPVRKVATHMGVA